MKRQTTALIRSGFLAAAIMLSYLQAGCPSNNTPAAAPPTPTPCSAHFGNDQSTGLLASQSTGSLVCYPVTLSQATTALDMGAYTASTSTGNINLALYTDDGGSPSKPLSLLASSGDNPVTAVSWNVYSLTKTALLPAVYWIGFEVSTSCSFPHAITTTRQYSVSQAYGPWPAAMPTTGTATSGVRAISLYLDTCP